MRLRVKHTFYVGEVTNIAGSSDNPMVEITMKDGCKLCYPQEQLTEKPPLSYIFDLLDRIKLRLTP
jgi:hypothetical protein